MSEDGDCLVFGCRRVLFKLESDGSGQEIQLRHLGANEELSLLNWTEVGGGRRRAARRRSARAPSLRARADSSPSRNVSLMKPPPPAPSP